jgi:hypothetical protein
LAVEPWTAPHEAKAARASSGLVLLLPERRSQAGMTVQLPLPPSLREMNSCSLARSCMSLRPESGTWRCVQWSPLQQHGKVRVPRPWRYDEDPPVFTGHQESLEVGDCSSESDLVNHHEFPWDMVKAILQLGDSRELTVPVGTAKAGIVQAINHNRSLFRQAVAILNHLWEDGCDSVR